MLRLASVLLMLLVSRVWAQPLSAAGAVAPGSGLSTGDAAAASLVFFDTPIPANGSLLVSPSQPVTATLFQTTDGRTFDLSLRPLEHFLVLTPTEPLQPGAAAHLTLYGGRAAGVVFRVELTQPRSPQRPDIQLELAVDVETQTTAFECCEALPEHDGERRCFPTRAMSRVRGIVSATSSEEPSALTQVLFRARPVNGMLADAFEHVPLPYLSRYVLHWENQADEYCVELDAVEIGSGAAYSYPELAGRCVPHAALGEVGEHPAPIDAAHALSAASCQLPPSDLAGLWCETNRAACDAVPASPDCDAYGHVCRGEALPRFESAQARREREEREEYFKPKRLDQGLCTASCLGSSRAARSSLLVLLGLLLVGARRRRSRRRAIERR